MKLRRVIAHALTVLTALCSASLAATAFAYWQQGERGWAVVTAAFIVGLALAQLQERRMFKLADELDKHLKEQAARQPKDRA